VSSPDRPPADFSPDEQEEFARTFYIKAQRFWAISKSHARTLFTRPSSYIRGLFFAMVLSKWHPRRLLYSLFYFVEAVILGQQLRKAGLSHVHSHFTSTVALLTTKIFPVTMSITIHGFREFRDPDGFRLAEKLRSSLFVVAVSNYCRSQLMLECDSQIWRRISVVPLGVHSDLFQHRRIPAPKPCLEIICVARLVHLKGHSLLIDAVERLIQQGFSVRLTLVGDGPERPALEETVKKRSLEDCICFTGPINPADIRRYYAAADIFALASLIEGLPIALMEAMAMGIPCLAPCIAGIPELIRDGENGLLFHPGNVDDLIRALKLVLRDPALRKRMGKAARSQIVQHHNLHVNNARLAEVFHRELLGLRAAPGRNLQPPQIRVYAGSHPGGLG
jgi:glycosyltransferase involved in cell wall biosynthesis